MKRHPGVEDSPTRACNEHVRVVTSTPVRHGVASGDRVRSGAVCRTGVGRSKNKSRGNRGRIAVMVNVPHKGTLV